MEIGFQGTAERALIDLQTATLSSFLFTFAKSQGWHVPAVGRRGISRMCLASQVTLVGRRPYTPRRHETLRRLWGAPKLDCSASAHGPEDVRESEGRSADLDCSIDISF